MDFEVVEKFNPYHKPAGSPDGGQFTTVEEGGQTSADDAESLVSRIDQALRDKQSRADEINAKLDAHFDRVWHTGNGLPTEADDLERKQLREALQKETSGIRPMIHAMLKEGVTPGLPPLKVGPTIAKAHTKKDIASWKEAHVWVSERCKNPPSEPISLGWARRGSNSSYLSAHTTATKPVTLVREGVLMMAQKATAEDFVHELGHHLEHYKPEIFQEAKALWLRRSGVAEVDAGSKQSGSVKGGGYYINSQAWRDGYSARIYTNKQGISATEVISTGLAQMYQDPAGFLRRDREHFLLTVKALR